MSVDEWVKIYGETYRKSITHCLEFLDKNEHLWNLELPIDRDEYVENVMLRIHDEPRG